MRKIILLLSFFTITPFTLLLSAFIFTYHSSPSNLSRTLPLTNDVAYAAIPTSQNVLGASIDGEDKRLGILTDFFSSYNSKLTPYASLIIQKADEYGIDYRLLPAIAMQESILCKREIANTHNCWGWGIYGKHVKSFDSYEEAIDTISQYFATKKENGIETLDEIGKLYNPGNVNNWKENVALIMSHLQ